MLVLRGSGEGGAHKGVVRAVALWRGDERRPSERRQTVDPPELLHRGGWVPVVVERPHARQQRRDQRGEGRSAAVVHALDHELGPGADKDAHAELLGRVLLRPVGGVVEAGGRHRRGGERVGVPVVDVDGRRGHRLEVEGRDDGEAGAGAAECPEQVRVDGRRDRVGGAVGEDHVQLDNGVDEQAPQAGVEAEAAEGGMSADADGRAGAVWETGGADISWTGLDWTGICLFTKRRGRLTPAGRG